MIALDASYAFSIYLIIDGCDSWQGGLVARARPKKGESSIEEMLASSTDHHNSQHQSTAVLA